MSDAPFIHVHAVLTDRGPAGDRRPVVDYLRAVLDDEVSLASIRDSGFAGEHTEVARLVRHFKDQPPFSWAGLIEGSAGQEVFQLGGTIHDDSWVHLHYELPMLLAPSCFDQVVCTSVTDVPSSLPEHIVVKDGVAYRWAVPDAPIPMTADPVPDWDPQGWVIG